MLFLDIEVGFLDIILRTIGAVLCNFVYSLISWVYQLFMSVASLNILSSGQLGDIYERITLILTIVMTFYITFTFVKYVVQPDGITEKEKGVGNVAMRLILVIIMIAFVPKIFDLAFELQSRIIKNQVISKVILGNVENSYADLGSDFAADVLEKFYYVDMESEACLADKKGCEKVNEQVVENLNNLRLGNGLDMTPGLMKAANVTVNGDTKAVAFVQFDFLWAMIVGGIIGWILVLYCVDVGVRYAQIIFLEVISPVAIMGYIMPKKDGIFQKWLKQCITTYLDLFIRILIINFVVLIISVLGSNFEDLLSDNQTVGTTIGLFTYIALIIGLLLFAQKAPKMIQELLPSSGAASIGYGMSGKDRFSAPWNTVKGTWGAGKRVVGGVASSIYSFKQLRDHWDELGDSSWNKAWSAMKALKQGIQQGAGKDGGIRKGFAAVRNSYKEDIETVADGGTPLQKDFFGGHNQEIVDRQKRIIEQYEEVKKSKKTVGESVKDMKAIQRLEQLREAAVAAGDSALADELTGKIKKVEKASRVYAMSLSTGDVASQQKAKADLEAAMSSAIVGTGFMPEYDNISKLKVAGSDFAAQLKAGTLSASIIDSLQTTSTMTTDLKEILKIEEANRTKEQQKQVDDYLVSIQSAQASADKWISDSIEEQSPKWNTIQIRLAEAKRISSSIIPYIGETEVEVEREGADGKKQKVKVKIKDLKDDEFAQCIGDISDLAETKIAELNAESEFRSAQANAQGSGKSGK